jgi:photosystem II stability/assembly factor-like uncharacterized protein
MTDRLVDEIRAMAEASYAPNPGLAGRVIERVREEPEPSRWAPWAKSTLAVALTVVVLVPVLGFGILLRANFLRLPVPGGESGDTTAALSLGSTGPGGDWVVRRGLHPGRTSGSVPPDNILYQTADGGRTWTERLRFNGGYDGISWDASGRTGTLWTIDWTPPACTPASGSSARCAAQPTFALTVYATSDGGLHWVRRPRTTFPAGFVFFRGTEGWVYSQSPMTRSNPAPIYHTTDAGAAWTNVGALQANSWGFTSGVGDNQFEFANARVGWLRTGGVAATGDSGLWITTDGGHSWTSSVSVTPPAGLENADVILGYPVLFTDGHAVLPVAFGHLTDPAYGRDPNHLAVSARYVYSSADGGLTWTTPPKLEAPGLRPQGSQYMEFYLDQKHWWITSVNDHPVDNPVPQGQQFVARTVDGGMTWQVFRSPAIIQMMFSDPQHGWAEAITGPNNTNILLRTTDGGAHWQEVQVP